MGAESVLYKARLSGMLLLVLAHLVIARSSEGGITMNRSDGPPDFMPRVGFGTCCRASAHGPALITSTQEYIRQGGRLIDTAAMYGNHKELRAAIEGAGISRDALWVTSKVNTNWPGHMSRAEVLTAVDTMLEELGFDYLDLILLHHAQPNTAAERVEQWRALLEAKRAGKAHHVGVSNYDANQLHALHEATEVYPAANEIEYHPWVSAPTHELVRWCQEHGIVVIAYGSLGSSANNEALAGGGVAEVAARHGVSTAAVLLRWALSRGVTVIPGATSAAHIHDNLHLKPFALSVQDEEQIAGTRMPLTWRVWHNLQGEGALTVVLAYARSYWPHVLLLCGLLALPIAWLARLRILRRRHQRQQRDLLAAAAQDEQDDF